MLLTKDQIIGADDLPYQDIEVPEWGGSVRVRTMTGSERDAFEDSISKVVDGKFEMDRKDYRAKLLSRVLVDDKGQRIFSDKEVDLLGRKSAKAIGRLMDVAQELNALSKGETEALEKK